MLSSQSWTSFSYNLLTISETRNATETSSTEVFNITNIEHETKENTPTLFPFEGKDIYILIPISECFQHVEMFEIFVHVYFMHTVRCFA